jgi:DNA modification methylase
MHISASTVRHREDIKTRLNDMDGREWVQATKTVLFQHGLGYSHPETRIERKHPAPFSYRDAERLIRLFSKSGESVLDPFCGVGSTLKACALSGRRGTGFELSKTFCRLGKERIVEEISNATAQREQTMLCGDARDLIGRFAKDAFAFILTSPPYWNILSKPTDLTSKYRKGSKPYGTDKRDFGCIADYDEFVDQLADFLNSLKRVLKPNRYMAVMVADFRHGEMLYTLQADLITALRKLNLTGSRRLVLQGIKIIVQNHKRLYPYGFPSTYVPNIHHYYVLVFRNIVTNEKTEGTRAAGQKGCGPAQTQSRKTETVRLGAKAAIK